MSLPTKPLKGGKVTDVHSCSDKKRELRRCIRLARRLMYQKTKLSRRLSGSRRALSGKSTP